MKLKYLFFILVILLAGVLLIVVNTSYDANNRLLYSLEALIFAIIIYLIYFYRKVIKPLDTIANGIDLITEQDFSSRLKEVGQYESDRIVQIFNQMMGQLKEERLRMLEQNHFLDMLISASPMGVVITTFDGQISDINAAALRFFSAAGSRQTIGKRLTELDSQLAQEISEMKLDSSRTIRLSDSMIYRCSYLSFVDRGFSHPFILIESLTEEVMKAEKKAYEKVIRMIAHEVNNTVAGITSTMDSVSCVLEDMDDTEDMVDVMRVSMDRCMSMSRFITKFADVVKIPEPQPVNTKLNGLVESCKAFMETMCAERGVQLQLELCDDDPCVNIDVTLLEQVVVNIIKNAVESIDNEGEVIIRTSSNPVMLEIADNGEAISREVEEKLFTPFFSTKPNGQGIGLIFIREVLLKHKCTFSLHTYPDGYTRFKITFHDKDIR